MTYIKTHDTLWCNGGDVDFHTLSVDDLNQWRSYDRVPNSSITPAPWGIPFRIQYTLFQRKGTSRSYRRDHTSLSVMAHKSGTAFLTSNGFQTVGAVPKKMIGRLLRRLPKHIVMDAGGHRHPMHIVLNLIYTSGIGPKRHEEYPLHSRDDGTRPRTDRWASQAADVVPCWANAIPDPTTNFNPLQWLKRRTQLYLLEAVCYAKGSDSLTVYPGYNSISIGQHLPKISKPWQYGSSVYQYPMHIASLFSVDQYCQRYSPEEVVGGLKVLLTDPQAIGHYNLLWAASWLRVRIRSFDVESEVHRYHDEQRRIKFRAQE